VNPYWRIDLVDCVKSQVKLSNTSSGLHKSFFFAKLVKASISGDKVIAICEDAVWTIDIETGNRKRGDLTTVLTSLDPKSDDMYIPEFLRKNHLK
jgi:tricorn protease-like protein